MTIHQYGTTSPTVPQTVPDIITTQVGAPAPTSELAATGSDLLMLAMLGVILILVGLMASVSRRSRIGGRRW